MFAAEKVLITEIRPRTHLIFFTPFKPEGKMTNVRVHTYNLTDLYRNNFFV